MAIFTIVAMHGLLDKVVSMYKVVLYHVQQGSWRSEVYSRHINYQLISKFSKANDFFYKRFYQGINKTQSRKLFSIIFSIVYSKTNYSTLTKGHSFCKQSLHNLQFMKTSYSSPNLSKLARADISCQFKKTRYLFTNFLKCKTHPERSHFYNFRFRKDKQTTINNFKYW